MNTDKVILCFLLRYTAHSNKEYKIDSCVSSNDRQILSGSEDGFVYIWDLIDVSCSLFSHTYINTAQCLVLQHIDCN